MNSKYRAQFPNHDFTAKTLTNHAGKVSSGLALRNILYGNFQRIFRNGTRQLPELIGWAVRNAAGDHGAISAGKQRAYIQNGADRLPNRAKPPAAAQRRHIADRKNRFDTIPDPGNRLGGFIQRGTLRNQTARFLHKQRQAEGRCAGVDNTDPVAAQVMSAGRSVAEGAAET